MKQTPNFRDLSFAAIYRRKLNGHPNLSGKHKVPQSLLPDKEPERKPRPKATYSNGGYLKLMEELGV